MPNRGVVRVLILFVLAFFLASCGNDPHAILFIQVSPADPALAEVGQTAQFTAQAQKQHVMGLVDISGEVTWTSSSTNIATISSSGLATGLSCGSTTISAQNGAVMGQTILTVDCGIPDRTQLIVIKTGTTPATVVSSPSGINCGTTCDALFDEGTGITLTGTPTPQSWDGCDQILPNNVCSLTLIGNTMTVTANYP
jgi:Big-like domain-containing protein